MTRTASIITDPAEYLRATAANLSLKANGLSRPQRDRVLNQAENLENKVRHGTQRDIASEAVEWSESALNDELAGNKERREYDAMQDALEAASVAAGGAVYDEGAAQTVPPDASGSSQAADTDAPDRLAAGEDADPPTEDERERQTAAAAADLDTKRARDREYKRRERARARAGRGPVEVTVRCGRGDRTLLHTLAEMSRDGELEDAIAQLPDHWQRRINGGHRG
jgi:hypothetical protein